MAVTKSQNQNFVVCLHLWLVAVVNQVAGPNHKQEPAQHTRVADSQRTTVTALSYRVLRNDSRPSCMKVARLSIYVSVIRNGKGENDSRQHSGYREGVATNTCMAFWDFCS